MYSRQNLIESIKHEHNVIKHLFAKIPEDKFDYKPTEKQRTTLELLQYLSMVTPATIEAIRTADTKAFIPFVEISKTVTAENFLELFDKHLILALESLDKISDEDLHTTINVFRMGDMPKGVYFVETILKWLSAYKMQLFLYIKASGNTALGTSNLWGGFDTEVL